MNETLPITHDAAHGSPQLHLEIEQIQPTVCIATVMVPQALVTAAYQQAILFHQTSIKAQGFNVGTVPVEYIESNFKNNLIDHLKEFLFKFYVSSFLLKSMRERKILTAGPARIASIDIEPYQDARFKFEISLFTSLDIQEWKYLPFKSPKRKNYRDLDRQVETFIKDEKQHEKDHKLPIIKVNDWVNFSIILVDQQGVPLIEDCKENFWFKIGDEEADREFHEIFVGHSIGDSFVTTHHAFQNYFSSQISTDYHFLITIVDVLFDEFFCLESFKRHFRLKTNKEMHKKLIEVYSFRNDLSLRRDMVEEAFRLLLLKNKFDVPNHMILRQQNNVLNAVQNNPDYYVYRMQPDFKQRVRQLAEKQAKEALLIDQLAYDENVQVSDLDIRSYLNLTKRPRMKDFLHFELSPTRVRGQELPIPEEEIKQICLREKTLNFILYHLTRL